MNLVSLWLFHAQNKPIFIRFGNTPPHLFCFFISVKYFCFIKAFYSLSLFIPCCFPVLCSAVLVAPYPFDFFTSNFFKPRNLSLLHLHSLVGKGQTCWQKNCQEDWPWRLAAPGWEESHTLPPAPIIPLCFSGAVGRKGRTEYC